MFLVLLTIILGTLGAVAIASFGRRTDLKDPLEMMTTLGWTILDLVTCTLALLTCFELPYQRGEQRVTIQAPAPLHRFIARKGSIAVDGVSLTVNEVEGNVFGVNIIPHTWEMTTLGRLKPGSKVNLEIDMLARYLARWQETA